ncbi:AlwI family type II restriction endonuclease [Brevibacillus laterosporus]|uniref:AlwI family type II restriction endonuclease n=1 Tax=Brevibacillus laterosporus TaxID=1465 RepID=UPI003D1C87EF
MAKRKVWFITRPERDPKFHRDALIALSEATDNFTVKWTSNRSAHLKFEHILNRNGSKRANISNDGSGGRTWAAMLKTFAYVYIDEEGTLRLTKVGKKIIEAHKVRENVTKQILTLQIPNAYFLESGFRPTYEQDFHIRPARFLIKLTNQEKLNYYLTKEEITFFALTAKKDSDLNRVTDEIYRYRESNNTEKSLKKQQIAELFDHRERVDKMARNYEKAHGDVAHTFMLICDYTGLVEYIRGDSIRINQNDSNRVTEEIERFDQRYPFNSRYLISLQRMAENNGLDIDSYKASGYGTLKPVTNKTKTENKIRSMLANYPTPNDFSQQEIYNILRKEFPEKEAEKHSFELTQYRHNSLNIDFVESYLNEQNNLLFEDKTGEVFKSIGFDVEMRPKPNANVGTEIEILLKIEDKLSCIIDAKNYRSTKFVLSANLASHMASEYIPNYEGFDNRKVGFFGYVTASGIGGVKNLEKISLLAKRIIPDRNIKGTMLSANVLLGFLDYCIDNNIEKEERIRLFLKSFSNCAYTTVGELLQNINVNLNN